MKRDKIIAFERDVIRLAAKDSGFSEAEIKVAYDKFCSAMKKAVGSGEWASIDLPIGTLHLDVHRLNDNRPSTHLGFCRPHGHLRDLINIMKVEMDLSTTENIKKFTVMNRYSEMKSIGLEPEKIEQWQNEDFKDNYK